MNEFNIGMGAVSADELEQAEGGFMFGWGVVVGMVIGGVAAYGGAKSGQASREGGEALPGLGQFLVGTTAIATAAGGRPQ